MTAEVIKFPSVERDCRNCENAAEGPRGTFCLVFVEMILDERTAAADCDVYQPAP